MKTLTKKEVTERDDIQIFEYSVNHTGLKMLEFGALFLFVLAVIVYPVTHFDPPAWMIAPIILATLGIASLVTSQYWRGYAQKAFLAYDHEYFFVGNHPDRVACIPWKDLDIKNSGLAEPGKGADFVITIDNQKIHVRLFTMLVCIPQFETVLRTILKHIQNNRKSENK